MLAEVTQEVLNAKAQDMQQHHHHQTTKPLPPKQKQQPERQPSLFKLGLQSLPSGLQLGERLVRQGSLSKRPSGSSLKPWQLRTFALTTNGRSLEGSHLKYSYPQDCVGNNMLTCRGAVELSKCSAVTATGNTITLQIEDGSLAKMKAGSKAKASAWAADVQSLFDFYQEREWSRQRATAARERATCKHHSAFIERRTALRMAANLHSLPFSPRDPNVRRAKRPSFSAAADTSGSAFPTHILKARSCEIDSLWHRLRTCRPTLRQHGLQAVLLKRQGFFPHAPSSAQAFIGGFKQFSGTNSARKARQFERRHSGMAAGAGAGGWNHARLVSRWFGGGSRTQSRRR